MFYPKQSTEPICDFIDSFKIEQPSIKNATISEYIRKQSSSNKISEWSICIVSNTDDRVFIDHKGGTQKGERKPNEDVSTFNLEFKQETLNLGKTIRNQQIGRNGEYYLISRNQIDDTNDRQVDLSKTGFKANKEIKEQRSKEKKGLLLIYALDERGAPNVNLGIPVVGYSLHFPKIDDEIKVSYTATINKGFDDEVMEDDDNYENE